MASCLSVYEERCGLALRCISMLTAADQPCLRSLRGFVYTDALRGLGDCMPALSQGVTNACRALINVATCMEIPL